MVRQDSASSVDSSGFGDADNADARQTEIAEGELSADDNLLKVRERERCLCVFLRIV